MTGTLVLKLLRDLRWALLVVVLILAGFQCLWMKATQRVVTQLVPFFAGLAAAQGMVPREVQEQVFHGPGKVLQTLLGGERIQFERAMDMLAVGYIHPLMQTIFCVWAIGRAAGALAGELDRGTAELLLAQPIARSRLILAHLVVDALVIPVLCLSLWSGTLLGGWLVGPFEVDASEAAKYGFKVVIDPTWLAVDKWAFAPGLLNIAGLLFAVSGLTMALSARGRFRWQVVGQAVLLVLVQFLVNVIGQLWDAVAFLRPCTLFYYYQPQQIILHQRWTVELGEVWNGGSPLLAVNVLVVLFAVGAIGYALALGTFCRRDLPAPL